MQVRTGISTQSYGNFGLDGKEMFHCSNSVISATHPTYTDARRYCQVKQY